MSSMAPKWLLSYYSNVLIITRFHFLMTQSFSMDPKGSIIMRQTCNILKIIYELSSDFFLRGQRWKVAVFGGHFFSRIF